MAGYLDGQWRIGSKARGTRSPLKYASEGILPFKCTYPVHLTDVMDQVPSAQSDLLRGAISPIRETRTLAVREYEENIQKLKQENFDLKLQLYLKDQNRAKNLNKDVDEEDSTTVKLILELQVTNEALSAELEKKDRLLQEAVTKSEVQASQLEELQKRVESQAQQSISKDPLEWQKLKEDNEEFEKENDYLKNVLSEKDTVIQNANAQIQEKSNKIEELVAEKQELDAKIIELEAKLKKRSSTLQGIIYKYHNEVGIIPKELRPIVQNAVQAAKECKEEELNCAVREFKSSLRKFMPKPSSGQEQDENEDPFYTEENSATALPSSSGAGQQEVSNGMSPSKLLSRSSESIAGSTKSFGSESVEQMENIIIENEQLKADNEDKAKTIEDLNSTCSELERRNIQLLSDLNNAVSKVKLLETKVIEATFKDKRSLVEAAVQCSLMQSYLSDSVLHNIGQSENVEDMKEEIYRLLLVIEQKEKEMSDIEQELGSVKSELEKIDTQKAVDRDIFEIKDLEHRLAQSNQVNHELMVHLKRLEKFMEDLLEHKNLDSSSVESLLETSTRLTSFLNDTRRLSHILSDHISDFESSKLLDPIDVSMKKDDHSQTEDLSYAEDQSKRNSDAHSIPQGRLPFSQSEPNANTARTGKRRLSFSTLHNASRMDSENVVVLGTSNNEDLILLLNEKGDPEDVLIRNNQTGPTAEFYGQPRHVLDSWNRSSWPEMQNANASQDRSSMERLVPKVLHKRCPSSDSDIWSEPDRDVSLQRIGIDVQRSPVAQKSPRRLRLRTTNESSSLKNESSSSAVKCHPWSKRRRSGDNSKSPISCKKCLSQSSERDAELDRLQKVINDLHNKCNSQENKLEETSDNLIDKIREVDTLSQEKLKLLNSIKILENGLNELRAIEKDLTHQLSESTGKLTGVSSENVKLKNTIKALEAQTTKSGSMLEKLKQELEESKKSLQNLGEHSTSAKSLDDYKQKYDILEEKFNKKTEEIQTLSTEKLELLSSIETLEKQLEGLTLQLSESTVKLTEVSSDNSKLKTTIKRLETQATESDSNLKKLEQELEQTRKNLQNLDAECSEYQLKLLDSTKSLESSNQKYSDIEKEKSKYLTEIHNLVATKDGLLQSLHQEKQKVQEILSENRNLKEELEEKSKTLKALQSQFFELENSSSKLLEENEKQLQALNSTNAELKQKFSQKLIESDALYKEKLELSSSIKTLEGHLKELNVMEKELTHQLSKSTGKLTEVSSENVQLKNTIKSLESKAAENDHKLKRLTQELTETQRSLQNLEEISTSAIEVSSENDLLKNTIKSLETKANESDYIINKLKQELKETKRQLQDLDEKCSKYEINLSTSAQSFGNLKENYNNIEKEKNKFKNEIQELVSVKNELLRSLHTEKEKVQQIQSENSKLKIELEKKSQSLAEVQSQYSELVGTLSSKLEEKENQLHASNSTCDKLKEKLKKSQESYENLVQSYSNSKKHSLLDMSEQISELQTKLLKSQTQLTAALEERSSLLSQVNNVRISLEAREKALTQSKEMLSSTETKLNSMQQQVESDQALLKMKDEIISELQTKLLNSQAQLTYALQERSEGSFTSAKDEEMDHKLEKYAKKIKSLKKDLVAAEQLIENLEKKNDHLREHIFAQADKNRTASQSSDEVDKLKEELDHLQDQLKAKSSCIQDLKNDMFETNNSLMNKQKEIDDLKRQLSDIQERYSKLSREEGLKFSFSQPTHADETETNIQTLTKSKRDIIKSILGQQKQFYERKNLHLGHLKRFFQHIEKLEKIWVTRTKLRSGSEPALNSSSADNHSYAEKYKETMKNLETELEIDVECLQNIEVFLKRFFIPIALESCDKCAENVGSSSVHHANTTERSVSSPEGSQEYIFQRTDFSSPDLGIESDPNRENSAPEQSDKDPNRGKWSPTCVSTSLQEHATASESPLCAIVDLRHYELLKKEIQLSFIKITSLLSKTSDPVDKYNSPRKTSESFATIRDAIGKIALRIDDVRKLMEKFWISTYPSTEELNKLVQQNLEMKETLEKVLQSKQQQELGYNDAMARLKQAGLEKELVEKKLSKQLLKTKKTVRLMETKLLEARRPDMPPPPPL